MEPERIKSFLLRCTVAAALIAIGYVALRYVLGWLLPFLLGFLIAYLLRPAADFIDRHSGMGKRAASIVSAVVFYTVLIALLWLAGLALVGLVQDVGKMLPAAYEETIRPRLAGLVRSLGGVFPRAGAGAGSVLGLADEALGAAASSASEWGVRALASLVNSVPLFVLTLVFTILSSVLICAQYEAVASFALRQIPQEWRKTLLELRDFTLRSVGRSLKAYLILTAITFAELVSALCLLGVRYAPGIAALIALLDFLPVLGSGMVLVPWAIYAFCTGDVLFGWGLLGVWAAVSVVREMLEPKLVGAQIGLPPLAALSAMYFGLRAAGVWGLVLAPVLCLMLRHLHETGVLRLYR